MSRDNGLLLPIQLTTDERQFLVLAVGAITLIAVRADRDQRGFVNGEADKRTDSIIEEFARVAERVDHIALMRRLSP